MQALSKTTTAETQLGEICEDVRFITTLIDHLGWSEPLPQLLKQLLERLQVVSYLYLPAEQRFFLQGFVSVFQRLRNPDTAWPLLLIRIVSMLDRLERMLEPSEPDLLPPTIGQNTQYQHRFEQLLLAIFLPTRKPQSSSNEPVQAQPCFEGVTVATPTLASAGHVFLQHFWALALGVNGVSSATHSDHTAQIADQSLAVHADVVTLKQLDKPEFWPFAADLEQLLVQWAIPARTGLKAICWQQFLAHQPKVLSQAIPSLRLVGRASELRGSILMLCALQAQAKRYVCLPVWQSENTIDCLLFDAKLDDPLLMRLKALLRRALPRLQVNPIVSASAVEPRKAQNSVASSASSQSRSLQAKAIKPKLQPTRAISPQMLRWTVPTPMVGQDGSRVRTLLQLDGAVLSNSVIWPIFDGSTMIKVNDAQSLHIDFINELKHHAHHAKLWLMVPREAWSRLDALQRQCSTNWRIGLYSSKPEDLKLLRLKPNIQLQALLLSPIWFQATNRVDHTARGNTAARLRYLQRLGYELHGHDFESYELWALALRYGVKSAQLSAKLNVEHSEHIELY